MLQRDMIRPTCHVHKACRIHSIGGITAAHLPLSVLANRSAQLSSRPVMPSRRRLNGNRWGLHDNRRYFELNRCSPVLTDRVLKTIFRPNNVHNGQNGHDFEPFGPPVTVF